MSEKNLAEHIAGQLPRGEAKLRSLSTKKTQQYEISYMGEIISDERLTQLVTQFYHQKRWTVDFEDELMASVCDPDGNKYFLSITNTKRLCYILIDIIAN